MFAGVLSSRNATNRTRLWMPKWTDKKKTKKKTLAKGAINHSLHDLQGADTLKA